LAGSAPDNGDRLWFPEVKNDVTGTRGLLSAARSGRESRGRINKSNTLVGGELRRLELATAAVVKHGVAARGET
jgi:hypothetical protein